MFDWLLDASIFMTRNHCGQWTNTLISVNQAANFLIFLSYMTIPISIMYLWARRPIEFQKTIAGQNPWIMLMFALFIFSCGIGHLMNVLAFSWTPYRFFTFIDCVTAIASVPTALLYPNVVKKFMDTNIKE